LNQAIEVLQSRSKIRPLQETNWMQSIRQLFAKCCPCCKNQRFRAYELAQEKLERDMDVVRLIKHNWFIRNALKYLLSSRERRLLRMQARSHVVNLDPKPDVEDEGHSSDELQEE
jgi:hypothetical protein